MKHHIKPVWQLWKRGRMLHVGSRVHFSPIFNGDRRVYTIISMDGKGDGVEIQAADRSDYTMAYAWEIGAQWKWAYMVKKPKS